MDPQLTHILRCPETGKLLKLEVTEERGREIYSGVLVSEGNSNHYPIREFIPRFVPADNYADNFGMQWNLFRKTQLDSHSGHPISANRFWLATGWKPEDLKEKWVLDVGCGAGRFAEIALGAGAKVVALDYSNAVEACHQNLGGHPNLHVIQGDIYNLPLKKNFFSFVYCLGVLQHTPDVPEAFKALPPMLTGEGRLAVDVYQKSLLRLMLPKYWLRPLTKRLSKQLLFGILQRSAPALLGLSNSLGKIPFIGSILKRLVPVANYTGIYPLTSEQLREWALLDTFDWLSPEYDQPQTAVALRQWFSDAGLADIGIAKAGHLVGRGIRAAGPKTT